MLVADGGLATELEARGNDLPDSLWSARLLMDAPEQIRDAHLAFFRAGAMIATSASYQASFEGFASRGLDRREAAGLMRRSVDLARAARDQMAGDGLARWVAASVGPYGAALADGSEYRGCCRDFADALREALGLAPYIIPAGAAPAPGHRPPQAASPLPGFPGPAAAGNGKAGVQADLAAAATMDSVSLVRSLPRGGAAGEKHPAPTQDAADPRHMPAAPFAGQDGRHSGGHGYAAQDDAGDPPPGQLVLVGPAPASKRRGGRAPGPGAGSPGSGGSPRPWCSWPADSPGTRTCPSRTLTR